MSTDVASVMSGSNPSRMIHNCIDSILNLVNFLHKFSSAGVSGFSLDVGPAAQQVAGELGLGAVVPGHQGRHAVSRGDQSLVVHAAFVAKNNN